MNGEDLDSLKRNPAVLNLYSERLRLTKRGREYDAVCPFHSEKTPSFQIFEKDGTFLFHCKGCGQTGNAIQFVERFDKIPFAKALEKVQASLGDSWVGKRQVVEQTFRPIGNTEKIFKTFTLEQYAPMENALAGNSAGKNWLVGERGITYDTAKRLHYGYRQDVGKMAGDGNPLADKGWISFPSFKDGKIALIKYRSIVAKKLERDGKKWLGFCRQGGMETILHGLESVDMLEPLFVVEGECDRAIFEQSGYKSVSIPNATTEITPEMKDAMLQAECVILAGDNDGKKGTEIMNRLWAEMKERTFLLQWSPGVKDCNQFFLETCGRDLHVFRTKIDALVQEAKSRPMAGIYSLQESLMTSTEENVKDDPNRFRFSLPSVDRMAIISPGSVVGLMATSTGQGKTTFVLQETLESARKYGEVVLNYQAELTIEQVARIVTAHTLRKHRLELTKQDMQDAARMLGSAKYYVGRNATLTTITPVLDLIEAAIRRLSPTVVVLDNIHYLVRNETDQVKAMENAMQRIKSLAVLYKLKFFVLGAPKKAESTSKGKQLHVTDARGSVTFGDDSDAVFTIHRDMLTNTEDRKNDYSPQTKLRLVKVRDKGPGDAEVDLYFLGEIATFSEVARSDESGLLAFGGSQ